MQEENDINETMMDYKGKLVNIKIRAHSTYCGIFLEEGEEYILIRNISGDYIIDGFKFINKRHLSFIELIEKEPFRTIIDLKHDNFALKFDYDLDCSINLFESIKRCDYLVFLTLSKENVGFVGTINQINTKSMSLVNLSPEGKFTDHIINYKYDTIRTIEIKTDYLKSLEMYLSAPK